MRSSSVCAEAITSARPGRAHAVDGLPSLLSVADGLERARLSSMSGRKWSQNAR